MNLVYILFAFYVVAILVIPFFNFIAHSDRKKIFKWVRVLYWKRIIQEYRTERFNDVKVNIFIQQYLSNSAVARKVYIDNGYIYFKMEMLKRIQSIEKYLYNHKYDYSDSTSLELWKDENDFIDNYYITEQLKNFDKPKT